MRKLLDYIFDNPIALVILTIFVVIIIWGAPPVYENISEIIALEVAQDKLASATTASIKAICQRYGIDEYKMEVVFPDNSDIFYRINITAHDSDISQTQTNSFLREVWDYRYEDPEHYWIKEVDGQVKFNGEICHDGRPSRTSYWDLSDVLDPYDGKCILSHCNHNVRPGKDYCWTHSCCLDECNYEKDPSAHCCSVHSCAHKGCGMHRYTYIGSKYCQVHYDDH